MNVSCIILNYNDAQTTQALVQTLKEYNNLDSIVVVDNHSTDDSPALLKGLAGGKVHFVSSETNGGYGSGNNLGIRYAHENLHATHALIANPDIRVSKACIDAMKEAFLKVPGLAVSSAIATDSSGAVALSSWSLHGLFFEILDTGLITRRLFKGFINKRPELETAQGLIAEQEYAPVDAVAGSLFLADIHALIDCGLYDEEVFLYYEEKILGYKLKEKGYLTILLLHHFYVHLHSVSIDKSVNSIMKKQALLHKSKLYYYKKYLKINRLEETLVKGFLSFLMAEIWFLTKIIGLSW